MRRLLSLVLLAAFGLPIVAPLFALGQDPDASLPACCRRHGKHHCAMLAEMQSHGSASPQIGSVCPLYPQHILAPVTGAHLIVFHPPHLTTPFAAALAPAARAETHRRIVLNGARHKRGPPSSLLA